MKKSLCILLATILIVSVSVTGCGGGGGGGGGGDWSGETFNWRVQSYTPRGSKVHDFLEHLVENIERMSGGRMNIEVFAVGELVASFDMATSVRDGVLDATISHAGLWTGLETAMPLFTSTAGEFSDPFDVLYWLEYGGGMEIWREVVSRYNTINFVTGVFDAENFLWTNTPVRSIEDLLALRIRMMPLAGEIIAANGGQVVFLPGEEIVPSIERGVIDGGEFATAALDEAWGFHHVARYYHVPGWHQPSSVLTFDINMDSWNALPADLQAIIEHATRSNTMWTWMENGVRNQAAEARFEANGNVMVQLPEEMLITLNEWATVWFEEQSQVDPLIARIRESQKEFMQWWVPYKDARVIPYHPWVFDRADEMPRALGS